jgi:hypothetical protein
VQTVHAEHFSVTEDGRSTSHSARSKSGGTLHPLHDGSSRDFGKETNNHKVLVYEYYLEYVGSVYLFCLFIYLFIYYLFNDGVSSSDHIASNNTMNE